MKPPEDAEKLLFASFTSHLSRECKQEVFRNRAEFIIFKIIIPPERSKMGKKVIDSLPDEVLLHIFEMLDGKTLKDCCLTCLRWEFEIVNKLFQRFDIYLLRWNTLIGTSSKIMQKFEFELKLHELRWFADITRNIHTIRIQKESMSPTVSRVSKGSVSTELETILEKHGADLRQVKISETDFDDFGHLLKHLPRLERLELNSVVLHKTRNRDPLTLSKLKHLMISDCDDVGDEEILHILKAAPKLTSLQLYDSKNRTKLLSFVLKLQSLESLSIGSSVGFTTSEDINLTTVPFRLKKFAIRTIPGNSVFQTTAVEHEYFKKFLKLHEDSLVDLYLNQYFSIECYQLILSQFKNLQRLDINVSHLPTEKTFYVCLSPLLNVKILKLRGTFANHETGKLFFQNFPSIESLDMKDMETKGRIC